MERRRTPPLVVLLLQITAAVLACAVHGYMPARTAAHGVAMVAAQGRAAPVAIRAPSPVVDRASPRVDSAGNDGVPPPAGAWISSSKPIAAADECIVLDRPRSSSPAVRRWYRASRPRGPP